jgi:hypothetical protein
MEELADSIIQGGSNMTGTNCDLFTHKSSRSYLNHLVTEEEEDADLLVYCMCEGATDIAR